MTPKQLYDLINSHFPTRIVPSICYVDKNCSRHKSCKTPQCTPVLDFDKIKDEFYQGAKRPTPASVDAIAIGQQGTAICFVELKGWLNYIKYLTSKSKTITETVNGYNLAGKLADSQALCVDLSEEPELFADMPVRFILVTDIDPQIDGIEYIHSTLVALGETSTEIYSQCISESKKILESDIHIEKVYIHCRFFDDLLKNI